MKEIKTPHAPMRMCVICRKRFMKTELVKFIEGPDGSLMPDDRHKLPGRSWYHCANENCVIKFRNFRPKRRKVAFAGRESGQGEI